MTKIAKEAVRSTKTREGSVPHLLSDVHLTSEEFMAHRARILAFAKEFPIAASAPKSAVRNGIRTKTILAVGALAALGGILVFLTGLF